MIGASSGIDRQIALEFAAEGANGIAIMTAFSKSIPMGKSHDIASAVLYVASDDARFLTGAEIVVDGGVYCN